MRMRLPSRLYLFLFCVVSIPLGCVSPVFASELTLSSLSSIDGLSFQSLPVDQSAIAFYDFSNNNSQALVIPQEPTLSYEQPILLSQDILETTTFIQGPVDLPPSNTPTIIPSPTVTPTDTPSKPTASPTEEATPPITQNSVNPVLPTTTPAPTTTPTPIPTLPAIPPSSDIDGYFVKYSNDYHVDVEVLRRIARCESGYNAHAQYMDYGGMFQFATSSWIVTRQAMGMDTNPDLRFSAEEAIRTAAYKIGRDGTGAWPNC